MAEQRGTRAPQATASPRGHWKQQSWAFRPRAPAPTVQQPKAKQVFSGLHVDSYYLLTTKSATSRFPKFSKDLPAAVASREEGGKGTVLGSGRQGCVHADSTNVGPDAAWAGHPPAPRNPQMLHSCQFLLPKGRSPFKNDQAQVGGKEEVMQEKELHIDF